MNKAELRDLIRQRKRQMTEAEISEKSRILTEAFLNSDAYRQCRSIYGYLPYNQEVRTQAILERALLDGKAVAIAKCYGSEMRFIRVESLSGMQKLPRRAPEPIADSPVAEDPTALVLMPGLAFDPQGHRLGYGGGYYDRFLAAEPNHPTVALCFDFQMVDHLQTQDFDVPADLVLWA